MFIERQYLALLIVYLFFAGGYAAITLMGWLRGCDRNTDPLYYVACFIGAVICGAAWPLTAIVASFVRTAQNAIRPL